MQNFFSQPYPLYIFDKKQISLCIVSGLSVFLVLYIFKPFRFDALPPKLQFSYAVIYGLVTLLTSLSINIIFPLLFPKFFIERFWNTGRELIITSSNFLLIAVTNLFTNYFLENGEISLRSFVCFVFITLAVGAFPAIIVLAIKQHAMLKKFQTMSDVVNAQLTANNFSENNDFTQPPEKYFGQVPIKLTGDNQLEYLNVSPDNLFFLEASDNYVSVHYFDGKKMSNVLLRSTLKKMEAQLSDFSFMVRCHRSYIINKNKIESSSATAQGLKLKIEGVEEAILVGKTYNEPIKQLLGNHN